MSASPSRIPATASRDISFEVQAGETVAIVGPTGAGKTTLINLLQRVYDPSEGRILIDGIDTRTVSRKSLRQSIASVFQDAGLFNRTIEENIRIGCADARLRPRACRRRSRPPRMTSS